VINDLLRMKRKASYISIQPIACKIRGETLNFVQNETNDRHIIHFIDNIELYN
jgi:hypothetical protein